MVVLAACKVDHEVVKVQFQFAAIFHSLDLLIEKASRGYQLEPGRALPPVRLTWMGV